MVELCYRIVQLLLALLLFVLGGPARAQAPARAPAPPNAVEVWEGWYRCNTRPGLFGSVNPSIYEQITLELTSQGLAGSVRVGEFIERFTGSVDPSGMVFITMEGVSAGQASRTSRLHVSGSLSGSGLFVTGERVEQQFGRTTQTLECVLALSEMQNVAVAAEAGVAPAMTALPTPIPQAEAAKPAPAPLDAAPAATRRRALVIGNDGYRHVPRLANARADAKGIGDALDRLGFLVTRSTDVNEREFKHVLRQFRAEVQSGDEVVVYFAGHGVQLGGANYLLPVDIQGDNEDQVRDEALPLQRMLDDLADRRAGFVLAIVDACRDNPFRSSTRSIGGRGLAPTTAATGQMVIFSAGSGQRALDRLGPDDRNPHGLFTRVFLREMESPNVTVDRVLRNVRNEVVKLARAVGHEQTPALYDQAVGDFYLFKGR